MSDFDKAWKVAKESEDDWIFNDWDNDKFEDGRPQWTMMQECPTCGSIQISNDSGWRETRELCSDGGEDHNWEFVDGRRTDELGHSLPVCAECDEDIENCYCQDEHGNYIHP